MGLGLRGRGDGLSWGTPGIYGDYVGTALSGIMQGQLKSFHKSKAKYFVLLFLHI